MHRLWKIGSVIDTEVLCW